MTDCKDCAALKKRVEELAPVWGELEHCERCRTKCGIECDCPGCEGSRDHSTQNWAKARTIERECDALKKQVEKLKEYGGLRADDTMRLHSSLLKTEGERDVLRSRLGQAEAEVSEANALIENWRPPEVSSLDGPLGGKLRGLLGVLDNWRNSWSEESGRKREALKSLAKAEAALAKCTPYSLIPRGDGRLHCNFCENDSQKVGSLILEHKPDCLWRQAVENQKRGELK